MKSSIPFLLKKLSNNNIHWMDVVMLTLLVGFSSVAVYVVLAITELPPHTVKPHSVWDCAYAKSIPETNEIVCMKWVKRNENSYY